MQDNLHKLYLAMAKWDGYGDKKEAAILSLEEVLQIRSKKFKVRRGSRLWWLPLGLRRFS